MNPLLEQFLAESRECLQEIGERLMELENDPVNAELMTSLFRLVHTLKGNSGLFDFCEMTRVLHAGEDLMDAVRHGRVAYTQELADRLLDAMDFVGVLCDEIESSGAIAAAHADDSSRLAESLRAMLERVDGEAPRTCDQPGAAQSAAHDHSLAARLALLPMAVRENAESCLSAGEVAHWLHYTPDEQCFFQGTDPFFLVRNAPRLLWGGVTLREPLSSPTELDAYRCVLDFELLTTAPVSELDEYFRYAVTDIRRSALTVDMLRQPARALSEGQSEALSVLLDVQRQILALPVATESDLGRLRATAATLGGCANAMGYTHAIAPLEECTAEALAASDAAPLLRWINDNMSPRVHVAPPAVVEVAPPVAAGNAPFVASEAATQLAEGRAARRTDETAAAPKSLKVDQEKIDRLMNLIGEMIVSKNALPYLANRAESVFGSREMSREIKTQYAVINRIVEEMQDAIMQVRMMPVSFVFQRFPRLVREISRKLGKDVQLILEGEETEADKNMIEALSDPLIHIVRNSLDHGIETPGVRLACGKPAAGTLLIRAHQESDRVVIEIRDDGKGIDPQVIRRKAAEKQLRSEEQLAQMTDQEAIQLIFAAGFSTMDVVSDLSGRGVGMDVVRTAIERVNGTVSLESVSGSGTTIRLSLPLSMAVTNVMIIESDKRTFGVPMECVVETVRVPRSSLHTIKHQQTMVLRGRVVPIRSLNDRLAVGAQQRANAFDEVAVLVLRLGEEFIGVVVDDFRGTSEVILKPMTGVLATLSAYSGSALMGDGSVLMVLNPKELF